RLVEVEHERLATLEELARAQKQHCGDDERRAAQHEGADHRGVRALAHGCVPAAASAGRSPRVRKARTFGTSELSRSQRGSPRAVIVRASESMKMESSAIVKMLSRS